MIFRILMPLLLLSVAQLTAHFSPLYGVPYVSLSDEQRKYLTINGVNRQYVCPGDTLELGILAINFEMIPPSLLPVDDMQPEWQVRPETGISIDRKGKVLVVDHDVSDGTMYTISAKTSKKATIKDNTIFVYRKDAIPFAGHWKEEGGNISEFIIHPDRSFSLTIIPFETYKDYWGHVSFDPDRKTIAFIIEGGNKNPADADLQGMFRLEEDGSLVLEGIYFGTIIEGDRYKQKYRFRKSGT